MEKKHRMEITEVRIDKIKADPNQPRQANKKEDLNEMARSILTAGVINPIEVDENFMIITGERRWKAAKIAGLETVPVKIIDISEEKRFVRQLIENIHQNTMAPLDTAMTLDQIRKSVLATTAEARTGKGGFSHGTRGVLELHELLGIPESTITRYLKLLGEDDEMKEALRTPGFQVTKIELAKEVPIKYRSGFRKLIAKQKSVPRDTIAHLANALRRAERYGEDYEVSRILRQNYEGLSSVEALNRINGIIPDEESRIKEPADALKLISAKVIELMELLEKHPLISFDNLHRPLVVNDLKRLGVFLTDYFQGNSGVLEGKLTEEVKLFEK